MDPTAWPDEPMNREVKGGRGPLLAVAILHVISGVMLGNAVRESDPKELVESMRVAGSINCGVGLVFLGIWYWAKINPVAASTTGLTLFVAPQVVVGVVNPSGLLIGLVPNIIIFVLLVRSLLAAKAWSAWDKMEKDRSVKPPATP